LMTASSRPERCLCPSLSMDCKPYGSPEEPIFFLRGWGARCDGDE
jgi:hypothetical protein